MQTEKANPQITIDERDVPAQHCLVISGSCDAQHIPEFLGRSYDRLYRYASLSTRPGMPFARYLDWDSGTINVEAGVITDRALSSTEDIRADQFGGHRALYSLVTGPYSEVAPTYSAMQDYMKERNLETAGAPYEVYLNEPGKVAESELRTEIYWPVK